MSSNIFVNNVNSSFLTITSLLRRCCVVRFNKFLAIKEVLRKSFHLIGKKIANLAEDCCNIIVYSSVFTKRCKGASYKL